MFPSDLSAHIGTTIPCRTILRTAPLRERVLRAEVASHAYDKMGFLAGTDDNRVADLTEALLDPNVRAVLATRDGKGSYRSAHRLPFDLIRGHPKPLVGFSDITPLHPTLWRGTVRRRASCADERCGGQA